MGYIAVDLGTTNIKVIGYDENLKEVKQCSFAVLYEKSGDFVEFDAQEYFKNILVAIKKCIDSFDEKSDIQIVITGQAESLVVMDSCNKPMRRAISWTDSRGQTETEELQAAFLAEEGYAVTGQISINTTWPIVKLLWLKKHEIKLFNTAAKFVLIKDYILFMLTGRLVGEYTCYSFSYYFDYVNKCYWKKMLDYCGIDEEKLPELVPPCSVVGTLRAEIAQQLNIPLETQINCGALDHFCGMIGTGNIELGIVSESTGTVLSVASLCNTPMNAKSMIPCHCSPFNDMYVCMEVCESGGASLEWFKNEFIPDISYRELDSQAKKLPPDDKLLFLPYLQGISAPEYNKDASGVFYGINSKHGKFHLAYAVMEGLAHLLAKNVHLLANYNEKDCHVISTGGGAKSDFWLQLKANICGIPVSVPENSEAACFGCAIIAAVQSKRFSSYNEAVAQCVSIKRTFYPRDIDFFANKHRLFCNIYNKLFSQIIV